MGGKSSKKKAKASPPWTPPSASSPDAGPSQEPAPVGKAVEDLIDGAAERVKILMKAGHKFDIMDDPKLKGLPRAKVLEYLSKKGYNRTEQTLRQESSKVDKDGHPIHDKMEEQLGQAKYKVALELLQGWIDNNLDIYKYELKRIPWPIFVYAYLTLVKENAGAESIILFDAFKSQFENVHKDELLEFSTIKLPPHVEENALAKLYLSTKYKLPLNETVYYNLLTFLETNIDSGGRVVTLLLQNHCHITPNKRGPMNQYSFQALVAKHENEEPELEGIPGAFTGVSNQDILNNAATLKLGMLAMEPELASDVRAELEEEDARNPPRLGQRSYVEEFDATVKREDTADGPLRSEIPLPPSRAREVAMEVQKVKENRDRFRIDGRTGGIGTGISVIMYTFHNTQDSITCIEFSEDYTMVAVGTEESLIRVWNMNGDPLPSLVPGSQPEASRRLIGHSASSYNLTFSPATSNPKIDNSNTKPRFLVSCSSDGTIRLWSLEVWTCLITYKGFAGPVWNVKFSPFGHYFAAVGRDGTVRIWAQDHASWLRMMVGHDSSVNQIAWHPNGAYVFSAADNNDKTIRMWSFVTGDCVRIFPGHTANLSALECSPSGKIIASADDHGTIILWDIAKGQQLKRCKGHKGPIWSLSFSAESTALVSGGHDGTVRVWDVELPTDPDKGNEIINSSGAPNVTQVNMAAQSGPSSAAPGVAGGSGGGKKKGKDTTITPDQISAFPTKQTPVYKVKFTRTNMVIAGGCYLPK